MSMEVGEPTIEERLLKMEEDIRMLYTHINNDHVALHDLNQGFRNLKSNIDFDYDDMIKRIANLSSRIDIVDRKIKHQSILIVK